MGDSVSNLQSHFLHSPRSDPPRDGNNFKASGKTGLGNSSWTSEWASFSDVGTILLFQLSVIGKTWQTRWQKSQANRISCKTGVSHLTGDIHGQFCLLSAVPIWLVGWLLLFLQKLQHFLAHQGHSCSLRLFPWSQIEFVQQDSSASNLLKLLKST